MKQERPSFAARSRKQPLAMHDISPHSLPSRTTRFLPPPRVAGNTRQTHRRHVLAMRMHRYAKPALRIWRSMHQRYGLRWRGAHAVVVAERPRSSPYCNGLQQLLLRPLHTYQRLNQRYGWRFRVANAGMAAVITASVILPVFTQHTIALSYDLGEMAEVISPTPKSLQDKVQFDGKQQQWNFNASAADTLPGSDSSSTRIGGVTYSASLPQNINKSKGLTFSDARYKLDIGFTPEFGLGAGRFADGYTVYPLMGSRSQLVYTYQQDGVKEDIVLHHKPKQDTLSYSYKLQLPTGLEARIHGDGSLGIYGGDPKLFGNISFGSSNDKLLVETAREKAPKTELYYVIPAPEVAGADVRGVQAHFTLDNDKLTVTASGLHQASYPLSIDPTFNMNPTSCSWQSGGHTNDGNVSYTGCQLTRASLSGGTVGSWTTNATVVPENVASPGVVALNGYLYIVANRGSSNTYYAPINPATGAVGTLTLTTVPGYDARAGSIVTANGYIYSIGGINDSKLVYYTKPNADGTLRAWVAASQLNVGRSDGMVASYDGRIYVTGGCSTSVLACQTVTAVTEYAVIQGDGSLSAWTQSTSLATGQIPIARWFGQFKAYNGRLYMIGGKDTGGTFYGDAYYASILPNGSVGTWLVVTAPPTAVAGGATVLRNGYMYLMGGGASTTATNTTYVAKVYSGGQLGPWQTTASFTTARGFTLATEYDNRIYLVGGTDIVAFNASTTYNDIQYTNITPTLGHVGSVKQANTLGTAVTVHNCAVAYGGYLYVIGGSAVAGWTAIVQYAKINEDGSTGTWSTTTSMPFDRGVCGAAAYNGRLYVAGGQRAAVSGTDCVADGSSFYCKDVIYATINANGTLGSWSSGGQFSTTARSGVGAVAHNGYLYVMGGIFNNNSNMSAEVNYAPINADGTVGAWSTGTAMDKGRVAFGIATDGRYVFASGGRIAGSGVDATTSVGTLPESGGNIASWFDSGSNFTTARHSPATEVSNGYLYVVGGGPSAVTTSAYSDIQYAKINANGTLGAWTTSTSTITAAMHAGGVAHNGYFYAIGGCSTTATLFSDTPAACDTNGQRNNVQYMSIYNGGGGMNNAAVTNATTIAAARSSHKILVTQGYLYVLSGQFSNGTTASAVEYASLTNSGSLTFASTTSFVAGSQPRGADFTAYGGYIYKVGGELNSTYHNDVQYAAVCTGSNTTTAFVTNCTTSSTPGTLSSWAYTSGSANNGTTFVSGLQTARGGAAEAVGGRLYAISGCTASNVSPGHGCDTATATVESAPINSDGTIGAWVYETGIGSWRTSFASESYGEYIYIMGGCNGFNVGALDSACNALTNSVQFAKVTTSGLASDSGCGATWCNGPNIHTARNQFSSGVANGYLYIDGGFTFTAHLNDVQYAPIMSNGRLGPWQVSSSAFTTGRRGHSSAIGNGYLYVIGGVDAGTTYLADVQYMPLQATPAIARHTVLLPTDRPTKPANYFTTTSKQTFSSSINVGYMGGASAASPAFGTRATTYDIRQPAPTKYPIAVTNDGMQYHHLTITLDDSLSTTFGEAAGSGMTYFHMNYHANPGLRLRGGKTFNQNVQQSLDAR